MDSVKQVDLIADFAAQATIALESIRRERQYREAQMALAHANRVATMGRSPPRLLMKSSSPSRRRATKPVWL